MKSIVVLLTLFCLCQGRDLGSGGCFNKSWIRYLDTDRCYFVSSELATFEMARKQCESQNSQLAPVLTCDEQFHLSELLATKRRSCRGEKGCMEFWIDVYKKDGDNVTWRSADNDIGYRVWASGFPKGDGRCAFMNLQDSIKRGTWRNDDCNRQMKYVCIACPNQFVYLPEVNECIYVNTKKLKWKDAERACTKFKKGAKLLTFRGDQKLAAVGNFLQRTLKRFGPSFCLLRQLPEIASMAWVGPKTKEPTKCATASPRTPTVIENKTSSERFLFYIPGLSDCTEKSDRCIQIGFTFLSLSEARWIDATCDDVMCSVCEFE